METRWWWVVAAKVAKKREDRITYVGGDKGESEEDDRIFCKNILLKLTFL